MKNIYRITQFLSLLFVTIACHSDLDQVPYSQVLPNEFYNNLEEAEIGINGVYDETARGASFGFGQWYIALSSHGSHVGTTHANSINQNLYAWYRFDTSHSGLKNTWESCYVVVYRANQVINRTMKIPVQPGSEDEKFKKRIIAEAKFLRALTYFNMVRWWGGVPIITEERVDFENVDVSRSSVNEVYDLIIADLDYAQNNLFLAHWVTPTETNLSYTGADLGRATVGAAKGLLAKVYLARATYPLNETQYFQMAYNKAKEVIDEAHYELENNYADLFTVPGQNSHEWMFQINYDSASLQGGVWGGVNNPNGSAKAINQGFGRYCPTYEFVQTYELDDPRRNHNIAFGKLNASNEVVFNKNSKNWYCYKFRFSEKPAGRFATDMNAPVLRFGDVLLIYAEAAAAIGQDLDAYNALDRILARAQAGGTAPSLIDRSLTGDALLNEIFNERARELCFEGTSKFDLVRAGEEKFLEVLADQKWTSDATKDEPVLKSVPWAGTVTKENMLLPIPISEMNTNKGMAGQQNPGYN